MQASKRGLLIIQVLLWNWLWSASVAENPPGLCEDLPALTGRDFVALTANTTRLTVERSRHLTADLKIVQVFQDDALLHQETVKVRRVDEAVSCDHQHAVGDYRLWVLKRHSSGNLTAKVSVEVTQTWARAVLHAMTGKELKHLELIHSKTSFLSTFEIASKAQYLLLVCLRSLVFSAALEFTTLCPVRCLGLETEIIRCGFEPLLTITQQKQTRTWWKCLENGFQPRRHVVRRLPK